jgi:hypothetical protein
MKIRYTIFYILKTLKFLKIVASYSFLNAFFDFMLNFRIFDIKSKKAFTENTIPSYRNFQAFKLYQI